MINWNIIGIAVHVEEVRPNDIKERADGIKSEEKGTKAGTLGERECCI